MTGNIARLLVREAGTMFMTGPECNQPFVAPLAAYVSGVLNMLCTKDDQLNFSRLMRGEAVLTGFFHSVSNCGGCSASSMNAVLTELSAIFEMPEWAPAPVVEKPKEEPVPPSDRDVTARALFLRRLYTLMADEELAVVSCDKRGFFVELSAYRKATNDTSWCYTDIHALTDSKAAHVLYLAQRYIDASVHGTLADREKFWGAFKVAVLTINIADAKSGTTVYDRDGDQWVRGSDGATVTCTWPTAGEPSLWEEARLGEAAEKFGPFTRILLPKSEPIKEDE